ncbi:MAG: amidohydrolase [Nevskia sp.]|nr:amidohydrolase [Nevskia sp.]
MTRSARFAAALLAAWLCLDAPPAMAAADAAALHRRIDELAAQVDAHVIANRRYIHQHPELSNREYETAKYVAARLRELGLEVHTGVAKTGVVAVLHGGLPGPVVALRSELDALPVVEQVDLPFKSNVRTTFDGKEVGVMHACGHDAHMGMLLGVAELFVKMRDQLPGTVKFVFQPGEEGAPPGEEDGAAGMVREGVLDKVDVIFGIHVMTQFETGTLAYRAGGEMASADDLNIVVHGRQTHGAMPWNGVDPIVAAAQVVLGLQTITSRQMDLTRAPLVVTIGKIEGGVRQNIVPEEVSMKGTLRTLDPQMRDDAKARIKRTVESIAAASGATADVTIGGETADPVVYNDPALAARMRPTLQRLAGDGKLVDIPALTVSEDFSFFQQKVPGLFVFVGVRKPGASMDEYAPNHSPRFKVDESGLQLGVRTLANLAVDYMAGAGATQ